MPQTDENTSGGVLSRFKAEEIDKPLAFFGVNTAVTEYTPYLPELDPDNPRETTDGANPLWARKKLLSDDNFLNNTVSNMFKEAYDEESDRYFRENPEEYKKAFNRVKNQIYNNLAAEVLSGDDVETAIKSRQRNLLDLGKGSLGEDKIKKTILDNEDRYIDMGLVDDEGLALTGKALQEKFKLDEDFRDLVIEDHYSGFLESLSKTHNAGGIDTNNVDQMAQAYAVYREFGDEALTHIVNYEQHFDPSLSPEEQDNKVKEAEKFLSRATNDDRGVNSVLEEFYGSEDDEQGKFTFEPTKESLEMQMEMFPKDANAFTYKLKYDENFEKNDKRFSNYIDEIRNDYEELSFTGVSLGILDKAMSTAYNLPALQGTSLNLMPYIFGHDPQDLQTERAFYTQESGERITGPQSVGSFIIRGLKSIVPGFENEETYYDADAQIIKDSFRDGTITHYERNLVLDTYRKAQKGDEFTMMDILNTVMVNSKKEFDDDGNPLYRINLNDQDISTNLAVRTLRLGEGNMVRQTGEGANEFIIEPGYYERMKESAGPRVLENWNVEEVPVINPKGEIAGTEKVQKRGWLFPFITGTARGAISLGQGVADGFIDMVSKQVYEPMFDMATEFTRDTNAEPITSRLRSSFEGGGEIFDTSPRMRMDRQQLREREGFLENVAYGGGHMASYMWTSYAVGNAAISQLGKVKAFNSIKDVKNAKNIEEALKWIRPAKGGKMAGWAAAAGKAGKNLEGVSRGAGIWAKFELGEIVRQPFTPQEYSLYQIGELADAFEFTENGTEMTDAYMRSNRIAQIGADIFANAALSMAVDNILASTRFASNKIGIGLGVKKGGNSWKIENGSYRFLEGADYNIKDGYSPDMRRFFGNTMDELADLPQGAISETIDKFVKGQTFSVREGTSVQDVAYLFKNDADDILDGLYDNVRNTLDEYDTLFNGKRTSSEQLDNRAHQITMDAIDSIGDQIGSALKNSNDEELPFRFAQALRNIEPEGEYVRYAFNGERRYNMSLEEAQTVQNMNPGSSLVDVGEDVYRVVKPKSTFWASRVADKIEEIAVHPGKRDKLRDFLKKQDIDPDSTNPKVLEKAREATETFEEYYNTGVIKDGRQGVVVDIDGENAIVRFDDGTERMRLQDIETTEIEQTDIGLRNEQHRRELAEEARKKRLKKNNRELWEEKFHRETEQYQAWRQQKKEGKQRNQDKVLEQNRKQQFERLSKDDSVFNKYGIKSKFDKFIKNAADYKKRTSASVRKWLASLGSDGVVDYQKLGINKANIKPLDMEQVKRSGGLPKNVVYTRNVNGKEEHYITVRKTPEDFDPSLWHLSEETGELVMNPYVRRIDKNQSWDGDLPQYYKRRMVDLDGERVPMYVKSSAKEDGSVLINVQKPMKDNGNIKQEDIYVNEVDALTYDKDGQTMYRLVDEANQAVDIERLKGSRQAAPPEYTRKSLSSLSEQQLEDLVAKTAKNTPGIQDLAKLNVVAAPLLGFAVDVARASMDEEGEVKPIFTMLGGAMWAGRGLMKGKPRLGGQVRKKISNLWDQTLQPHLRAEKREKARQKLGSLADQDIYTQREVESAQNFVSLAFDMAKKAGVSVTRAATQNKIAQSMFSELEKMNSPTAKKLQTVLLNVSRTVGDIYGNPERRFNNKIYNQRVNQIVEQTGRKRSDVESELEISADLYTEFMESSGPQKMSGILDRVRGEEERNIGELKRNFDGSVSRIIETGARTPEQILDRSRQLDNKSLTDIYENHPMGDQYRQIDAQMMQDPEVQAWVNSHRDWFADVENRYIQNLDERFDQLLYDPDHGLQTVSGERYSNIANRYMASGVSTANKFIKSIETDDNLSSKNKEQLLESFKALQKDPMWEELDDLVKTRNSFQSFTGEYMPQMRSEDAEVRARNNFFARDENRHLVGETTDVQEAAWERHMRERFIEVNADRMKLNQLKRKDTETGELYSVTSPTKKRAEYEIRKMVNNYRQEGNRDMARRLQEEAQIVEQPYKTASGNIKKEYVVEMPNDLAYGQNGVNRNHVDVYFENYFSSLKTPNSNYLDNARKAYIPYEFRETNMDSIRNIYSRDTGRRIHNLENNMANATELQRRYIDPIKTEIKKDNPNLENADIADYTSKIKGIYTVANGMLGESEASLRQLQRRGFWSSTIRNLQFMRFGYGFGMYNLFEWAAIGSHIGGGFGRTGKAMADMTFNPTSTNNLEQLLSQELIFKRQIQFARPEFNQAGVFDYGMTDAWAKTNYYSAAGANKLGNFSILNSALGMFGKDMSNMGAARVLPIVGDSFLGSSMFASAVVSRASLAEASSLASAARKLNNAIDAGEFAEGQPQMIRHEGKSYSRQEIERKLELHGVYRDDQEAFINGQNKFNDVLEQLDNDPNFHQKLSEMQTQHGGEFDQYMKSVVDIVRTATESYNGINKMYRPETWDSNLGRLLSMYSTYSFNVSLQTLQRRFKQPLDQYFDKHDGHRVSNIMSAMEIATAIKSNNIDYLTRQGLTRQQIEEFPVDAAMTLPKIFSSVGISVGGYMSLSVIRDVMAIMTSEFTGSNKEFEASFESFSALERDTILNPFAPEDQRVSFNDLIEEGIDLHSFIEMGRYALNQTTQLGVFGRWGDLASPGTGYSGMAGLSPVSSEVDKGLRVFNTAVNDHVHYFSDSMPRDIRDNIINYLPVLGSNVFSQARRDWREDRTEERSTASGRAAAIERGVTRAFSREIDR